MVRRRRHDSWRPIPKGYRLVWRPEPPSFELPPADRSDVRARNGRLGVVWKSPDMHLSAVMNRTALSKVFTKIAAINALIDED